MTQNHTELLSIRSSRGRNEGCYLCSFLSAGRNWFTGIVKRTNEERENVQRNLSSEEDRFVKNKKGMLNGGKKVGSRIVGIFR